MSDWHNTEENNNKKTDTEDEIKIKNVKETMEITRERKRMNERRKKMEDENENIGKSRA